MSKEQLETDIAALELLVNDTANKSKDFTAQLEQAKKDLADVNKPELTPSQFDDVHEAIEAGIDEFDWSDTDNYEIEYGIDYDGRVNCENFELRNSQDLVEMVWNKLYKLFVETEDDNSQVNNATHVEKII